MSRTTTRTYAPSTGTETTVQDAPHGRKAHTFTRNGLRMTGILHTADGLPRLVNAYGSILLDPTATVWVH